MEYTREEVAKTLKLPLGGERGLGKHVIKTRATTYSKLGFLPEERYFLVEFSSAGRKSPLMIAMQQHRWSANANRIRYRWTMAQYRAYIVQEYVKMGFREKDKYESYKHYFLSLFRKYILYFKDRTDRLPAYDYPDKMKIKKKTQKQINKIDALKADVRQYVRQKQAAMLANQTKEWNRLNKIQTKTEKRLARLTGETYYD